MTSVIAKKKLKLSAIIVACLLVVALAVTAVVYFVNKSHTDKIYDAAIEELERYEGQYDTQSIVLKGTNFATANNIAEKIGAKLRITGNGRFATLTLPDGLTVRDVYTNKDYRNLLEKFSLDLYASVNEEEEENAHLPTAPKYTVADSMYPRQSYLDYLHLENVWERYKGENMTVAVIDTGIDTDHPEFAGRISDYSYNATEDKIVKDYSDWSLVEDVQGHGTSVAGVIAAAMDDDGIVGIAPSVTLLVIKCECNENGSFLRTSDLVFGLYYAVERDVDVVNMSFGTPGNAFSDALRLAVASDIICVGAAGNDSTSALNYPAADPNCIGVGALANDSWELAAYSNFGDNTDLVAPGTVYTTAIGGGYRTINGTSFASPIVAAAAVLLKQQNRYMEFSDVTELLYASSYDLGALGKDFYFGYGALDVSALILEERGKVVFDMLTDELDDLEYVFIRNHTLQSIPEPDRNYAVFDGWCYDLECKEDLEWYTDVFQNDITLYARWANEDDAVPYTYVTLPDGTIEIRSYTGHRRFITIPEKIDDKVVSSIGDFAFQNQSRLREVNLPSGLTNIGMYAFGNCENLLGIAIPDGVTTIGASAFVNNTRLQTVSLNHTSKLKTIGDNAFAASGLLRFDVTARVEVLDGSAFFGTRDLLHFNVAKENKYFLSEDGVIYNKTKSTVVAYPAGKNKEYTLPDSVTAIGGAAFGYTKLTDIDFGNVTTIGGSAFAGSSLKNVRLTDKIVFIGKQSFAYCYNLSSLTLGNGITKIPEKAFVNDTSLSAVEIPANVLSIDAEAFAGSGVRALTFAEGSKLLEIGGSAFASCRLSEVAFPASLFSIGGLAFAGNYSLSDIRFAEGGNLQYIGSSAFAGTSSLRTVDLPDTLVGLGSFAFQGSGLTGDIIIPASVTSFGAGAFASCHALANIKVASGNAVYKDIDGVVYTTDEKTLVEYPAGNSRTEYTVPAGTEHIFEDAFYGSHILTSVYLPEGLESIRREAFYDVRNLSSIRIPDSVMQISNYAFAYTDNLGYIYFTDNSRLPRISYAAFAYSGIQGIRIPAGVSTIAQGAFEGCKNLSYVTFAQNSRLESISAYLFRGASALQRITFENGSALTSIQAHGLEGMKNLVSVDFGDAKLTNIDNYAFRYCEKLASITIPEGVTYIGRFAFYGDKALTRVDLPTTVDYIGRYAFYGTTDMNVYFVADYLPGHLQENWDNGIAGYYVGVTDVVEKGDFTYAAMTDGSIAIIKYSGTETTLDLTALDLGGDIRQIGGYAFYRSNVKNIILPETLTTIQRYAFAYSALESVALPANVKFIGQYAFFHTAIKSVAIPNDSCLFKMEQYAFAQNDNLSAITLPASLETMGTYAFYGSALTEVTFADGLRMTTLPEYAFAGTKLTSVRLSDSINYIDNSAFRDCRDLQTVTFGNAENIELHANAFYNSGLSETLHIPANIRYIGEYAFIGLEGLSAYEVDEANPYYKSVDGVLYTKDGKKLVAFPAGRTGSFVVPEFVETVGFGAFENTKLDRVSFAKNINLLTLGYRAFYHAENLKEIALPKSLISIDYYAFAECRNLEKVTFAEGNKLTGIYEGAFLNCIRLSDIILPDSIIEISDFAFYGCTSIARLPIGEGSKLKGIYDYAFAYTELGELSLPDTVIDIGAYAFRGTPMKKIYISDAQWRALVIGIGALQECDSLEEVRVPFSGDSYGGDYPWFGYIFGAGSVESTRNYLPKSLRKISIKSVENASFEDVFGHTFVYGTYPNYLENIEEISLPDGLTSVGSEAFRECCKLSAVFIPESVTSIEIAAFYGCDSLTSIAIPESVTNIGLWVFQNCSSLTSIIIPNDTTRIEDSLFSGCSSLTSIHIPESVTSIERGAFSDCSSLTSISIPDGVTSIGSFAFSGCGSLTSIIIPDGVTNIESYTFAYCRSLTSITLPERVTSIGESAFSGCNSLTSVTIPDGVTYIGREAFRYCKKMVSITIPDSLTCIESYAFEECWELYEIKNNSDLVLTIGSTDNGYIAKNAKLIIDKNGTKTYQSGYEGIEYVETADGFRFEKMNGTYTLIAYTGNLDTVTLPTDINGNPYSIYRMRGVKNVILPEGMTSIGDYSFDGCSSLTSITIPESVTSIGSFAFSGCSSLTSISIPDGVTSIGSFAFSGCRSLTSISIPDGVTSIGDSAFYGCSGLTSIAIPDGITSIENSAFV